MVDAILVNPHTVDSNANRLDHTSSKLSPILHGQVLWKEQYVS